MFIGDPPGNYDRILDFSTAVTGSLFFVPAATCSTSSPAAPNEPAPGRAAVRDRGPKALPGRTFGPGRRRMRP